MSGDCSKSGLPSKRCESHDTIRWRPAAQEGTDTSQAVRRVSDEHLVARAPPQRGRELDLNACGGHVSDVYDGCLDEGIRITNVRHEQVAAHAGQVLAPDRTTRLCRRHGRPGHHKRAHGRGERVAREEPDAPDRQAAPIQHRLGACRTSPTSTCCVRSPSSHRRCPRRRAWPTSSPRPHDVQLTRDCSAGQSVTSSTATAKRTSTLPATGTGHAAPTVTR